MSANKTTANNVDVAAFIRSADPKKVEDSFTLVTLMERLSGEKATMWGPSIIGFGKYHYKYASGREGDMCRIGFSPRKDKFSLYVLDCDEQDQVALVKDLGKVTMTVSCIYFKKLADLDMVVLEKLIKLSLERTKSKWG